MPALVGDRVKKGDVIARLARKRLEAERDKVSATVATRRALVKFAQAEYSKKTQELRRITNLKKSSTFSRARYEDLQRDVEARQASIAERQSQLKEAQAQLNQVIIDLHNTAIRAPYNGVVSEKHTEVGAYVSVGTRVVSLINDTEIEVEAEVPSRNITGLTSGFPVRFSLDDGTQHRAIVRSVVPRENVRTRTRPVRFIPDFGPKRKALRRQPIGHGAGTGWKSAPSHNSTQRCRYLSGKRSGSEHNSPWQGFPAQSETRTGGW